QSDDAKGDARILTAVSFATAPLELPQRYFLDQMVGAFLQDQAGARTGRKDVLLEVLQIDVVPEPFRDGEGGIRRKLRVAMEEGIRIPERGFTQPHETLHIPLVDQFFLGIDIDGEIEEVRDEGHGLAVLRKVAR